LQCLDAINDDDDCKGSVFIRMLTPSYLLLETDHADAFLLTASRHGKTIGWPTKIIL